MPGGANSSNNATTTIRNMIGKTIATIAYVRSSIFIVALPLCSQGQHHSTLFNTRLERSPDALIRSFTIVG
jgi:hypothetical protein